MGECFDAVERIDGRVSRKDSGSTGEAVQDELGLHVP